jgi:hypothetical protein
MQEWSFMNNAGNYVTVQAETEEKARELAMLKLHGPPSPFKHSWHPEKWTGIGLMQRSP